MQENNNDQEAQTGAEQSPVESAVDAALGAVGVRGKKASKKKAGKKKASKKKAGKKKASKKKTSKKKTSKKKASKKKASKKKASKKKASKKKASKKKASKKKASKKKASKKKASKKKASKKKAGKKRGSKKAAVKSDSPMARVLSAVEELREAIQDLAANEFSNRRQAVEELSATARAKMADLETAAQNSIARLTGKG
ncbi:MAG: hypothetical protein ACXIUB_07610 [Wenzhouxiangella sp.]